VNNLVLFLLFLLYLFKNRREPDELSQDPLNTLTKATFVEKLKSIDPLARKTHKTRERSRSLLKKKAKKKTVKKTGGKKSRRKRRSKVKVRKSNRKRVLS